MIKKGIKKVHVIIIYFFITLWLSTNPFPQFSVELLSLVNLIYLTKFIGCANLVISCMLSFCIIIISAVSALGIDIFFSQCNCEIPNIIFSLLVLTVRLVLFSTFSSFLEFLAKKWSHVSRLRYVFLPASIAGLLIYFFSEFYNLDRIIYDKAVIPIVLFSIIAFLFLTYELPKNQYMFNEFECASILTFESQLSIQSQELQSDFMKTKHDIRNNLFILKCLSDSKSYDELKSYLDTLVSSSTWLKEKTYSDCKPLNLIINNKVNTNALISFSIHITTSIPDALVNNICTLTFNILDNAISECNKILAETTIKETNPPVIDFRILFRNQQLCIICNNPTTKNLKRQNFLKLTKPGLGLNIINSIVKSLNGETYIDVNESFIISISIPISSHI